MAEPQRKVGDVVQLKSGGPKMTIINVTSLLDSIGIECAWFDDKNSVAYFPASRAIGGFAEGVIEKRKNVIDSPTASVRSG